MGNKIFLKHVSCPLFKITLYSETIKKTVDMIQGVPPKKVKVLQFFGNYVYVSDLAPDPLPWSKLNKVHS